MAGKRRGRAKLKVDELARVASDIGVPATQAARAHLELVTVQNRTDDDQRHMVRSGKAQTVKRTHMLDRWRRADLINDRQLAAGNAWAELRHAGRYDAVKVADYAGSGGGSPDPLARVIPFAASTQSARFAMRDVIKLLSRDDIARLDAVTNPTPIALRGRAGVKEAQAIRLALSRLASILKIGA